ncbi:UNVERIFIED_CONTAM: hypothetical protein FKN15_049594 [Acipenser sinensis]
MGQSTGDHSRKPRSHAADRQELQLYRGMVSEMLRRQCRSAYILSVFLLVGGLEGDPVDADGALMQAQAEVRNPSISGGTFIHSQRQSEGEAMLSREPDGEELLPSPVPKGKKPLPSPEPEGSAPLPSLVLKKEELLSSPVPEGEELLPVHIQQGNCRANFSSYYIDC